MSPSSTLVFSVKRLPILVVLLLLGNLTWSQLDSIHYFAPIHSRQNGQIAEQYVYLSTPEVTPFTVTLVDGSGAFIGSAVISKDAPSNIYIGSGQIPGTDVAVPHDSVATVLRGSGFIASAPYDFYCNVRIKAPYQATSIACKGRAALGTEFYVGSMPQVVSNSNRNFVTSFMATEDGTIVTVNGYDTDVEFETPGPGDILADELTILLNAGDCYVLTGYTTTALANMDGFIGARIVANNPIAINTGNYMGSIHSEGFQDGGMVQIVPTNLLGTEYIVVEGDGGDIMERPLVVGVSDGTEIYLNDAITPITTINTGDYYLVPATYYGGGLHANMAIRTSQPAYVYQATAATTSSATSEFNFVPPLECYLSHEIDAIPDIDLIGATTFEGVLYVVTSTGSTITINGAPPPPTSGPETVLGLADWVTYRMNMSGDVTINSTGAMAAGFIAVNGNAAAGAYYAGFNFEFETEAGPIAELCTGDSTLLLATGAGPDALYNWETGSTNATYYTPSESGFISVTGINSDGCEHTDSLEIVVFETPISNAGEDLALCDTNAATLDGNMPLETGYGEWSFLSGPAPVSFEDVSNPNTIVNDLIEGSYQLVWEVGNGTCPTVMDTVFINVYDATFSNAGEDQDLCGTYETLLEATPVSGSAVGSWNLITGAADAIITYPSLNNSSLTDLSEDSFTLVWTVTNGTCPASSDTVLIHVYDPPVANAGLDNEFCDEYSINLSANSPLGTANGLWTVYGGPSEPEIENDTLYNSSVLFLEEGQYDFVWTVSNGVCEPAIDTVTITLYETPLVDAGLNMEYCDTNIVWLNGSALGEFASGYWSSSPYDGSLIFEDSSSATTPVIGTTIGEYNFLWTVTNGTCPSISDTTSILIHPYPIPSFEMSDLIGCTPLTVSFTNTSTPIGDFCLWEFGDGYISEDCGDVTHTYSEGFYTPSITIEVNGCSTHFEAETLIEVLPIPAAGFSPYDKVIDITSLNVEFTNASYDATTYYWDFGDGSNSNLTDPIHEFPSAIDGEYEVMLVASNELGCTDTALGSVNFKEVLLVYVPNSFTPDNKFDNETFLPVFGSNINPNGYNLKIYNRWGEILFESYDMNTGWNGSYQGNVCADGVYVWALKFSDINTAKRYEYHGHVTLIR